MPGKETPQVADKTGAEHLDPWKWQPGQSGNPAGRPKSARSKVNEDFLKAFAADFADNGAEAIRLMRSERPSDYVKVAASLLPKQVEGSDDPDAPPIKTSLTVKFE